MDGVTLHCMVPGCTTEVEAGGRVEVVPSPRKGEQPLCARHWYRVPRELRLRLWELRDREPGSAAHLTAIDDVVAAAREGPP